MSKKLDYSVLCCNYCKVHIGTLWSKADGKVKVACAECCEKIDKWDAMVKKQEEEHTQRYRKAQEEYGEDAVICPKTYSPVDIVKDGGYYDGYHWCSVCATTH